MKKFYFNRINSVKSGNSGSASASPKARKLRMESLENRHLLAVGAPFPDACVEPDVSASAFYATETVGSSTSGATAIDISSALAEDSTDPDFVDEFDSTSADDLIQFSDDSEPEDELIDESQTEEDLGPVQTVLTLMQYFNSLGIKDYSLGYPRDVFFYSSINPECYLSTLDFSDESTLFIDLGARDDQVLNLERAFETIITRSGGGNEPEQPEDDPPVVGEITYSGSPFILEKNDGTINAPSDATYYIIHVPEVDYTYRAFLEFAPVVTATNPGAICGVDYKIAGTPATNGIYYPYFPSEPLPAGTNGILEVSGGCDYCVVPLNDGIAEDPEEFTIRFFIEKVSGGGERYYGNTLTATILDNSRTVNVSWGDGNYNNQGATLSANPRGGGARVYPEQDTASVNSLKNVVSLNFTLSEPAPASGQIVYFKLMDPDNYVGLGKDQTNIYDRGLCDCNDNYYTSLVDINDNVTYQRDAVYSIEFEEEEDFKSLQIAIPKAYAGDNWLAVAHTSSPLVQHSVLGNSNDERYQIFLEDGYTINPNEGDFNDVSCSQLLTIWRTLHVERDFTYYEYPMTGLIVSGMIPEIELAQMTFSEACITIDAISSNNNGIPLYKSSEFITFTNYQNILDSDKTMAQLARNVAFSTDDYWAIHMVGGWSGRYQNDVGTIIGFAPFNMQNTVFVFSENIANTVNDIINGNSSFSQDDYSSLYCIAKQITSTHELGHLFGLSHQATYAHNYDGILYDWNSIMGESLHLVLDYTDCLAFSYSQICTIQSKSVPR